MRRLCSKSDARSLLVLLLSRKKLLMVEHNKKIAHCCDAFAGSL